MDVEDSLQTVNGGIADVYAPLLAKYPEGYVDSPRLPMALTWPMTDTLDDTGTISRTIMQDDVLVQSLGQDNRTAAVAAQSSAIQIYRPMREIKHVMLILASHAYRRKDTVGREGDKTLFTAAGVLTIPQTIPREVADMIKAYKRPFIGISDVRY